MVPNDALINRLRAEGYSFKRQTDRVAIYKKRGTTARVNVRLNSSHSEDYVRILLKQAGCAQDEIDSFIRSVSN